MSKNNHILIKDQIESSKLFSRELINKIAKYLEDNFDNLDNIILDFSDIEFISRSAAHELVVLKPKYPNLIYKNLDDELAEIIRIVAASNAVRKESNNFNPQKVNFKELMGSI
ncbi:hypothetical protein A2335_04815 [Candidatus Peregrinibacteria bacterium RIFOXYB2_FULL_32_7]|nr:MAG: hypothetical protein A2335_04815 [Candidatus Peregrinibacteria bacterium RIFOXYB2_FULL_32_7]